MHNNARRPGCSRATLFGKFADLQFPPLRDHILSETSARSAAWLFSIGGDGIMNPRRFATVAPAFCGTVVLAGWIVAWLAGFGSAGIENTRAVPIENRAASLAANAKLADEPQAIAMGNPVIASAAVATAVESVTGMATGKPAASDEPESIVEAALPDPSQVPSAELAAEQAGLSPGITSAFRDDYRQSIASGLKAATDRSYHGGSFRGGYGHGLAADVVSVKGATRAQRWVSTESFWKWIDAHGKEFGIGRPYLDRDPPHLAPIDGKEYAARRGGTKAQHAESDMKKRKRLAVRDDRSVPKTPNKRKIVRAGSAARYTNQGAISNRPTMASLKRS